VGVLWCYYGVVGLVEEDECVQFVRCLPEGVKLWFFECPVIDVVVDLDVFEVELGHVSLYFGDCRFDVLYR